MGIYARYIGEEFFVNNFASHAHDHHYTTSAWKSSLKILRKRGIELGKVVKRVKIW